jgi:hypothetical protein
VKEIPYISRRDMNRSGGTQKIEDMVKYAE